MSDKMVTVRVSEAERDQINSAAHLCKLPQQGFTHRVLTWFAFCAHIAPPRPAPDVEHLKRLEAMVRISDDGSTWDLSPNDCVALRGALDAIAYYGQCFMGWRELLDQSGFDASLCSACGAPIICIPDGLPMCQTCATRDE